MPDIDTSPAALRARAEAATPGPWQVVTYRTPFSITRHDGTTCSGEHVGRDIATVRHHPQSHAPYPIVTLGIGVTQETPVHFVFIRPEDADYLAAVSPEVVLALLDTIDSLRASLAAAEKGRDQAIAMAEAAAKFAVADDVERAALKARAEKVEAERDALTGPLTYGPYSCVPEHAVQCAYLLSLAEAEYQRDPSSNAAEVLELYARGDVSIEEAMDALAAPDQPEDPAHD